METAYGKSPIQPHIPKRKSLIIQQQKNQIDENQLIWGMGMSRIYSHEWFQEFSDRLNSSEYYKRAARYWKGDLIFHIIGDKKSKYVPDGVHLYFWMDLYHGTCRGWEQLDSPKDKPRARYMISGKTSIWEGLIFNNREPIALILSGRLRLRGNMLKILRSAIAVRALTTVLDQVETDDKTR